MWIIIAKDLEPVVVYCNSLAIARFTAPNRSYEMLSRWEVLGVAFDDFEEV
jgi:hypothetical protein